jgi:malate synthase
MEIMHCGRVGWKPNIPVGSQEGVSASMKKAVAGAEREQRDGASGKWVAHWKMVHIVRPVWEKVAEPNQLGRKFPPLTYTPADAAGLTELEPAPITISWRAKSSQCSLTIWKCILAGYAGGRVETC